jgi:hypothetical protein
MAFRPAWLPEGVVEDHRISTVGVQPPSQHRGWQGDKHGVSLDIASGRGPGADNERLVVADIPMWIDREFDDICSVWRSLGPGIEANLTVITPQPRDVATRVAASLIPDGRTVCEVAMRFGWLPDTAPRDRFTIEMRRPASEPLSQVLYSHHSPQGAARAWATAGPAENAVLEDLSQMRVTDPVTVRGRPGMCAFEDGFGRVLVELGPGKWLCVNVDGFDAPLGRADLLRVAETLWLGDVPVWKP